MTQQIENRICYLYVLNTLADWETGFITAELKSGRYLLNNIKYDLITAGSGSETIETMGGISISPEKLIEEIDFKKGDLLILPGAETWSDDRNRKVLEIIPDLLKKGVTVAAICGATVALAEAGLLDNRKHTSNGNGFLEMFSPNYRGSSFYEDKPAVVHENLITASGLAPLEFAYEILKKEKAMKENTLEAWYQLYQTKKPEYFYSLMESL